MGESNSLIRRFTVSTLLVFILMGFILGYVVSNHFKDMMLNNIKDLTTSLFQATIQSTISPEEFGQPFNLSEAARLDKSVEQLQTLLAATRVRIWNQNRQLIYTSSASAANSASINQNYIDLALNNSSQIIVTNKTDAQSISGDATGKIIDVYAPIIWKDQVVGAFEVDESYARVAEHLAEINRQLFIIMFTGLLILYIFLWKTIFKASRTLIEQNRSSALREKDLQSSLARLDASYKNTMATLSKAIDARDPYTASHSERVTTLAMAIGKEMALASSELATLELAALFHDVGKLGIPDKILNKPGKLAESEYKKIREHPVIGVNILRNIDFLQPALDIIKHHHERFSGYGYPDGIQGTAIPLGSRIIAVADTYDAITSDRPYRKGLSHLEAMTELQKFREIQFDPDIVDAFLRIDPELYCEANVDKKVN